MSWENEDQRGTHYSRNAEDQDLFFHLLEIGESKFQSNSKHQKYDARLHDISQCVVTTHINLESGTEHGTRDNVTNNGWHIETADKNVERRRNGDCSQKYRDQVLHRCIFMAFAGDERAYANSIRVGKV